MKRFTAAIVALLALTAQVFAAGSIQLSGTQQFDTLGRPLSGGLLYTFQSGTTTPQSAFQDQALTIPWPNPMVLDASGRAPFFYLADGNIKIRLSDSTGVTILAADGLLVIGPSFGGGSGGGVDATTILATGDTKARYGTGVLAGFVRANGRTIGSATSGATERANADAQALFEYLWNASLNLATLAVSGGRGLTANADWLANKNIELPDLRGRVIAGLDDMGTTAASRLTATWFGSNATILGTWNGAEKTALSSSSQLPSHSHSGTVSGTTGNNNANHSHSGTTGNNNVNHSHTGSGSTGDDSPDHTHGFTASVGSTTTPGGGSAAGSAPGGSATGGASVRHQHSYSFTTSAESAAHQHAFSTGVESVVHAHAFSATFTTDVTGASLGFAIVQPTMVMTFYLKL